MAAAISPNSTWRNPENQILLPVNSVIADPIKNNPAALHPTLIIIAVMPDAKKKGITGIIAPIAKRVKE